jgi:GT2 family glycosyltransferase
MLVQFEDGGLLIGRTPDDFDAEQFQNRPIEKTYRMGEDVTFCLRARKAGYVTYGLPSVVVEHYKQHFMAHGRNDAEAHADLANRKEASVAAL